VSEPPHKPSAETLAACSLRLIAGNFREKYQKNLVQQQ
jgi:hypothetical protein